MSRNPKYTVAVINYNMAETLEESLRSVLDQLEGDRRFEALVIDDGSTDGSQKILERLEEEYELLRWIEGDNKNRGEARQQATEESKGEHIIHQIDTDDKYDEIFKDLIDIYEQLRENIDKNFYLDGRVGIGPKKLLEEIPFRSIDYGEDIDLALRLLAEDKIIQLDHKQYHTSMGYDYGFIELHKITFEIAVNYFRMGAKLSNFIKWRARNIELFEHYFQTASAPLAYLVALTKERYKLPQGYNLTELKEKINSKTLSDLEEEYDFEIDRTNISEKGKDIFYL